MHDLKIGEPTHESDFTLPKPTDAHVRAHDYGFRDVSLAHASTVVGYRALLPTDTLGRSLSAAAVANTMTWPFPGIAKYHDVLSVRYGIGPDSIAVSTRRSTATERQFGGPTPFGRPVRLDAGALAGDSGYVSASPLHAALLTAYHRGLIVDVHAPSTREALVVANSIRAAK